MITPTSPRPQGTNSKKNQRRLTSETRARRRRMFLETLESRSLLATITAGAGPGGFESFGSATSVQLWLDASDIDGNGLPDSLADNSPITVWADKSGFGRNLTSTGTVSYTLASAAGNNLPATRYSNSRMQSAFDFNALGADYTVFAVSRYTGGANQRVVSSVNENWLFGHWNGGDQRWHANGWIHENPPGSAATNFAIYTGIIGPSVPNADFWRDGTQLRDNAGGYNGGDYKPGRIEIGSWANGSEASNAEVSELVIINRKLNEAERFAALNAISAKYNIGIGGVFPAGQDAYTGDNPVLGNYDFNVIGIGRFDAANQLLSAGQAGFGLEATSIDDDNEFVGGGHNGVANTFTTASVPAGVARRWTRNWQVQVGDVDDDLGVTMAFDYSDAGLAIGSATTFALLTSLDGINWSNVGATANVSGDLITFNLTPAQLSSALYTLGDASGPILTNTAGNQSYSIGAPSVQIDPTLTLAAGGSATMTGATISIAGFVNGNSDVLTLPAPIGAITGSYNNTTGVLTLSGNDSVFNYQAALQSVRFSKPSYQTTPFRTINYAVTDTAALVGSGSRGMVINATAASTNIAWDGGGDGTNWTDVANWVGDVMPDANDVAVFANADPGLVEVSSDVLVGSISFTSTTGAFNLTSTGGSVALTVGNVSQSGNQNHTIDVGLNISPPAAGLTFDVAGAAAVLTVNGVISGPGGVTKANNGVVVLGGTNTYTGATNVNSGTLRIAGTLAVPPVPSGAAVTYTFESGDGTNTGSTGAAQLGNILGPASVVGGGLNGGNRLNTPYSGRLEMAAGLPLGTNWTLSAWWQDLHGTADWRTLFRSAGGGDDHQVIVQSGQNNLGMYDNATGGAFRDSGFDLLPASDGIWHHMVAVGNDVLNTTTFYVDGVLVGTADRASSGTLFYVGGLGAGQTYANYLDEVRVYLSALTPAQVTQLYQNGANIPVAASANAIPDGSNVTVNGGAFLDLNGIPEAIGALNGGGTVTSGIAGTPTLTVGGGDASGNFNGVIQNGAGTVSLTKVGTGTQTLTGAHTYGGATNILNGTLQITAGNDRLPVGTVLTLGGGATAGTLDLNGSSQTVAGLISGSTGANRVVNSGGGTPDFTVNVASGTSTYAGILGNAGQDSFNLIKTGAGTQVLTGTSSFTGMTTINGGTLSINNDAALGAAPGGFLANAITIANGATLNTTASFTLNANRGITLGAGGGTINVNAGTALTWGGYFTGGTGFTKAGTGDLILSNTATNSVPGVTNINAGRVFFHSQNSLGTGVININNGGTLDYLTGGALSLANSVVIASGGNIASRPAPLTVPNATLPTTGTLIVNQDDQNTSTVIFPQNLAVSGPLTIQVGGGGGNGGVAQFNGVISGSAAITKTQNGTLFLNNGGNTFTSVLNIAAGLVRVAANGALGAITGATNVLPGGGLEFNGAFNYTTLEPVNISGMGPGGIGAIVKTGGNGNADVAISLSGNGAIGAAAGSTLGIATNINLAFGNLTFVGAGNVNVSGVLQAGVLPANSIANLNSLATGSYAFNAAGQSFSGLVDNVAGTGWLLIGRGRQGWEFDTDGQGTPAAVNTGVGTSAAFTPAAYSDAIINDLLAQSGLVGSNVELRIRRAADAAGTAYQEARWRSFPNTFTLRFSDPITDGGGGALPITYEVVSTGGVVGATTGVANGNTRDFEFGGNDGDRIFTWPWSGHASQRGFSYGAAVNLVAGPSATNFLWENGGENHEIPYTEIYVRSLVPVTPPVNTVTMNGTGIVTLSGANTYAGLTTVNSGTLVAGSTAALGTNASGTVVNPTATLGFSGGVTITGEAITASGTGAAGQPGALVNIAGTNTLASPVTGTGAELRIGSAAGSLTMSGNVNMTTASLSFDGAGSIAVSGAISQGAALPLNGVLRELEIWLDASDPNADGSAVADGAVISNWQDKSGKNRDFDGVGGDPNFVLTGTHGRPTINFDGNDFLRTNNTTNNPRNFIDGNGEFTLISVARYSGATRQRVIGAGYNGHNWLFGFHGGSTNRNGHYDGWGSLDPAPIGFVNDTNWHLHANQMNVFSDPTNPAGDWWRDGIRVTDDSRGTGDAFVNNVPDGLEVGGFNGLGEPSTAEVSELLMFNRVLSDSELQLVQTYLNTKYSLGFPIPTTAVPVLTKLGTGTVTLSGNNTFAAPTIVAAGTLVAASANALGTTAGGTTVNSGGTLGLSGGITLAAENILLNGLGSTGNAGALTNISGDNTIPAGASVAATDGAPQMSIGSLAGTLTIAGAVNMKYARLVFDGAGATNINGAITATLPTSPSLVTLNNYPTGTYSMTAAGQTFTAYVNNDGTNSWLLLGRGREGWQFDTDGQGTPAAVSTGIGTSAAFAPAAYSDAIVNDLLAQAGINNTTAEFRIRRATDIAGTQPYQEGRWGGFTNPNFTFDFDAGAGIPVTATISPSALAGSGGPAATNTRDSNPPFGNDAGRIFTWAWGGHNNQQGFSYGSTVSIGNNAAGSFIWEFADENHAMPYAEFYIRGLTQVTPDNQVIKNGTGTVTLGGANTYSGATTINAGMLVAANNTALGTAGTSTTVNIGGALGFAGGVTVTEPVTVEAVVGNTQDSLVNVSGTNVFSGPLTFNMITPAVSTTIGSFTGGDVGDGLDLTGTFPYAVNMGGPAAGPVQGVNFASTAALPAGFTFSAPNEIPNWHAPNYGATTNDNNLESVMASIRWNTGPVTMDLANLTVGNVYVVQLLYAESCCDRGFDVSAEGAIIANDFAPHVPQGGINNQTRGAVITHRYQAGDTTLNISQQGPAPNPDPNPIISGITLEDLGPVRRDLNIRSDAGSLTINSGFAFDGSVLTLKGAGNIVLPGNLTQGAATQVVKTGAGTATLSGTNTYSGNTTISGGTLAVQGGNAILDTAGPVSAALGATFQLLTSETISSFSGAGDPGVGVNDSTLALGNNVLTTTAGAAIANVTAGTTGGIVAGTAITDADDDNNITATSIFLQASTGIGTAVDPIETTITNFEATTATGGVFVSNTGALTIGNVSAALSGVDVTGATGAISLTATGTISVLLNNEDVRAPGNVTLNAQGAASNILTGGANTVTGAQVESTGAGGVVTLTAGQDVVLGTTTPADYGDVYSAGSISINAGRDFILQQFTFLDVNSAGTNTVVAGRDIILFNDNNFSRITTRSGAISLTANRNVSIGSDGTSNTVDSTQAGASPAGANVSITATTGNISIRDGINAGTAGNVLLSAVAGSITDTNLNATTRVNGAGLTANSATGVVLETNVATVTSVTATGAGNINLQEVDALNLVTLTAANGSLTLNAGGALTNAAAAAVSASGAAALTAPSITLGTQAGDAVNFGTLNFSSTGTVNVEENSGLNLTGANSAAGAITLRSIDLAAAGQDIVLGAGATLTSTGSSITLFAGDDVTLTGNVSAATTVTVNLDSGSADAGGGTLTATGNITAPAGAFFNGGGDNDTFTVRPLSTAAININGNAPIVAPGDVLNLDLTGTVSPSLSPGGVGAGTWSFGPPHLPVAYVSIEEVNATGPVAFDLILNANLTSFGNTGVDDQITARMSGTDLIIERTGPLNAPNDFIGTIFQGDASNILSFSYVGSNDNETLTVSDAGGLMNFTSTVPGVPNNPNLAGQAEFLFNGNGGADGLVFNLTGSTASQSYAIGNGTGAVGLEGELETTSGGVTLMTYFINVESTQRTGSGATPGELTMIGDSSANTFATTASGANTIVSATGYTPFQFSGDNYSALNINAGLGADSLTLSGIGTDQTNPLAVTLNGEADADTLKVESTGNSTGVVTLNGGLGNDLFQLFSATNTVDGILGQVMVDGTDGNVGGNLDTLVVVDSGDVTGDTNVVLAAVNPAASADYRLDGVSGAGVGVHDIILRNIDVLDYTGTSGADQIDARLENTVPPHDLSIVTLNGWLGADQFLLFTSDQVGGSGLNNTPTGVPSGVAVVSLNGDAPGNPNGVDGNDVFGETPPGLMGTGSNNVGLTVPDTVRAIRPSVTTGIDINGGQPTGPLPPTGDTVGDTFNLDLSGLPANASLILPTGSGVVNAGGLSPITYAQIEDINLFLNNQLINVQMGDTLVRGTSGVDAIIFTANTGSGLGPNGARIRVNADFVDVVLSGKTLTFAGAGNDIVEQSNLNRPAEIYGEGGDDEIKGGVQNDFLVGGLGNDRINAGGGDNVVWGDDSPTTTVPNPQDLAIGGDDILSGLGGNDVFYGGGGNDQVSAGGGDDYASGGEGDDILGGSLGDDRLYGGPGNDTLGGGAGNDLVVGNSGNDILIGNEGNDVIFGGAGTDDLSGNDGSDLLITGSVANETSSRTSVASVSNYGPTTYSDPTDNDMALRTLLLEWASLNTRTALQGITHDGVDDDVFGGTGDDDFCWEFNDILDEGGKLTPPDFNSLNMGADERFGPT